MTTKQFQDLERVAEIMYPIPENMCAFRKQGQTYKRNALVWQIKKAVGILSIEKGTQVINELKAKAGIQ